MTATPRRRAPLVLIASDQDRTARAVERIVGQHGYAVLRAHTGNRTLAAAGSVGPDLIVLDERLPDAEGLEVSRALRDDPHVGARAPVLLITTEPPTPETHLLALRAGAWDFLMEPFHAEEVSAKLDAFVLIKFEADRAWEDAGRLVDEATGLYDARGLAQRARELAFQAFHHHAGIACVAFEPEGRAERFVDVLKASGRRSDAIGRIGEGQFAVVAPGTDAEGAVKLAQRLQRAAPGVPLRAGYDAVTDVRRAPAEPGNMLERATRALVAAKSDVAGDWIRAYTR